MDNTPATETTGAAQDTAPDASGAPLTVWVIEDSSEAAGVTFPNVRAGIKARVERINADGGLGGSGRPVQVEYCASEFDPNKAAECARQAAADQSAIAVAASVSANGDVVLPILEAAGLASVGGTAFSASDGVNPVSFPIIGGLVTATGCQASVLVKVAGSKSIGVARGDTPGADQVGALLTALGFPPAAEVVTPVANPDYSAEMAAVAAKADGIVLASDGATALKAIRALRQSGSGIAVAGSGGQGWTPEKIKQGGDAVDGLYLAMWFATDDFPSASTYVADMEAIGARSQSDDLAKLGWSAFELLDRVASAIKGEINRASVLAGLNQMSGFDSGGLTPPLDFTKPGSMFGGAMPRFVNTSCVYARIVDGTVRSIDTRFATPFN